MEADNLSKQIDEIEALSSIYESDFITDSGATRSYSIRIKENNNEVLLSVTMPQDYPAQVPPKFEISAPWMDRKMKETLHRGLDEVYLDNLGEPVIYQCVEKIRELLLELTKPKIEQKIKTTPIVTPDPPQLDIKCPPLTHGQVIIDRKSAFQGHAAKVFSLDEVSVVLSQLKQNKKIKNATHNMYAYRIERESDKGTVVLQDCDDDGETHAGGRMLHLLQILNQKNTLVVVSRWYGGVQLGPDRFRHINNATRQVIEKAGLLK